MDSSPEQLSKPNNSTPSPPLSDTSLLVQESPVFSYLSNLSPIKPDKAAPVAQGFPGINSPPLVFQSPQINPNGQPAFLKRPQFSGSSDAKLSGQDKSCADTVTVGEESGISVSASSANLTPNSSEDFLKSQNDFLDLKESGENTEDKDGARTDEVKTGASLVLEQVEEDDLPHSSSDVKSVVLDQKTGDGNMPRDVHQNVEPDKCVDHAFEYQHGVHLNAENAGSGHVFEVCCASPSESLQIAEHSGSRLENAGVSSAEALERKIHDHSPKVIQQQHGISRRLQFEDAIGKIMQNTGFQNSSGNGGCPRSPASPANSEVLESASLNKPASPSNRLLANMTPSFFSPQSSGNCNMNVPKPSGIGLHLNSIVNSMQVGSGAKLSMKSAERGRFDGIANSASSMSPYSMNPVYEAVLSKAIELQSDFSKKGMSNSETSDSLEDFSQSSPKKKRKKTLDTGDSNGCKRCNCKKTKCLKLYCDCFAAGIYCAEPCACQGCFNRPEYEDTVLETRQQIESRNPLAFAPKIIQHLTEPPTNEDGDHFTPSSARHKRGCNCKKSKCLKKYCECYQANVGCSDGCRCEACENIYGRKGEFSTIKDLISKHSEKLDSSFDTMESLAPKDDLLHNELYNPYNLTPLTPSLQCSDHGKGPSKAWLSSAGYLQSPESGQTFITPYGLPPEQATNPDNHDMIPEANTEAMDLVSFGQGLDYGNGHTVNQFIPRSGVPGNTGHFTSLPNLQDWANTSRAQIFPGNRQVSSANSLRWRSSPITLSTHSEGTKLQEVVDSDGLYGILDDDTPEILKETPEPPNAVKVSSPNKKRVSPPHGQRTELSSSSSAGLRNGRKFILQAVPSFPPLTPCIDSKGGNGVNNSQNSSSSK